MRPRTEWVGKEEFATLAALLAIPADLVMAATQAPGGGRVVLYSDGPDLDSGVWIATVRDGVVIDREETGWTVAHYLPPLP